MKFEYLKNLRGENGERFADEPVDYRTPVGNEWYVAMSGKAQQWNLAITHSEPRLILHRVKTAREWLQELPDGWREEALAHHKKLGKPYECLYDVINELPYFDSLPTGGDGWEATADAIEDCHTPPPHPSTVKPAKKIVRLPVVLSPGGHLCTGKYLLSGWIDRSDFRGFVFVLPGGREIITSVTIIWASSQSGLWSSVSGDGFVTPLRPSFVEVES